MHIIINDNCHQNTIIVHTRFNMRLKVFIDFIFSVSGPSRKREVTLRLQKTWFWHKSPSFNDILMRKTPSLFKSLTENQNCWRPFRKNSDQIKTWLKINLMDLPWKKNCWQRKLLLSRMKLPKRKKKLVFLKYVF